jgi:hypothetical protein
MLVGLSSEFKAKARKLGYNDQEIENAIVNTQKELDKMGLKDPYISVNSAIDDDKEAGVKFSAFRYIGMHPYTTTTEVEGVFDRVEEILTEKLMTRAQ